MTRAEPPHMVKATIEALLSIKAPNDEILIVDNNHKDHSLYEPLQTYCNSLDDSLKVRFFHEDHIAGYKAGALNYALSVMDKSCDYIVVVDSDYQEMPWARHRIIDAINHYPSHILLQFPQYYRNDDSKIDKVNSKVKNKEPQKSKANKPDIHSELNHYFSYHLNKPYNKVRALSTGTFAVIHKAKLLAMGGWSGDSITEDSQMGVLMHLHGERTQYIPEVIASGLLPCNLADLIAQRRRWIYGNMQVLLGYPKLLCKHDGLNGQGTRTSFATSSKFLQSSNSQKPSQTSNSDKTKPTNHAYSADRSVTSHFCKGSALNESMSQTFNDAFKDTLNWQMRDIYFRQQPKASKRRNNSGADKSIQMNGLDALGTLITPEGKNRFDYLRAHFSQLSAWVNLTAPFIMAHGLAILVLFIALMTDIIGFQSLNLVLKTEVLPLVLTTLKLGRVLNSIYNE